MSQQEMQFGNPQRSESGLYQSGYEAVLPHYDTPGETDLYNPQKVTSGGAPSSAKPHPSEHLRDLRVGMAITSLALWVGVFLIALAILLHLSLTSAATIFIFLGMGFFSLLVVLANLLVNRDQF